MLLVGVCWWTSPVCSNISQYLVSLNQYNGNMTLWHGWSMNKISAGLNDILHVPRVIQITIRQIPLIKGSFAKNTSSSLDPNFMQLSHESCPWLSKPFSLLVCQHLSSGICFCKRILQNAWPEPLPLDWKTPGNLELSGSESEIRNRTVFVHRQLTNDMHTS